MASYSWDNPGFIALSLALGTFDAVHVLTDLHTVRICVGVLFEGTYWCLSPSKPGDWSSCVVLGSRWR